MKYLLILIPFINFAQNAPQPTARQWLSDHDDVAHFYGSFFINDAAYSIQGMIWRDRAATKKLLISNAFTASMIAAKETYDIRKANPTGWNWFDVFIGVWAMLIYTVVRICINDLRKSKQNPILEP